VLIVYSSFCSRFEFILCLSRPGFEHRLKSPRGVLFFLFDLVFPVPSLLRSCSAGRLCSRFLSDLQSDFSVRILRAPSPSWAATGFAFPSRAVLAWVCVCSPSLASGSIPGWCRSLVSTLTSTAPTPGVSLSSVRPVQSRFWFFPSRFLDSEFSCDPRRTGFGLHLPVQSLSVTASCFSLFTSLSYQSCFFSADDFAATKASVYHPVSIAAAQFSVLAPSFRFAARKLPARFRLSL
jgi:hypothetical protein